MSEEGLPAEALEDITTYLGSVVLPLVAERGWAVQPVGDPDEGEAGFAYTIGLAQMGCPSCSSATSRSSSSTSPRPC